jgi:hypothetical protein
MFDLLDDDLVPLTVGEVRQFLSTWHECALDDLGIRKQELVDILDRAITSYIGKKLTPKVEAEIRESLQMAAAGFARRHTDIRFTKCDVDLNFGTFDLNVKLERSGLSLKTFRKLPKVLRDEIGDDSHLTSNRLKGRKADFLIVDDPFASKEVKIAGQKFPDSGDPDRFVNSFRRLAGETDQELRDRIMGVY